MLLEIVCIVAVSIAIGIGRLFVPGHDLSVAGSYEAFAHIWVGALLLASFTRCIEPTERWVARASLATITVVEIVMFLNR